jgi:ribose 5-phosphate isomerase A
MQNEAKRRASDHAIALVNDGQVVGLGTGSTAKFAIEGLGRRVSDGLLITGVPTSSATEKLAREVGIPLVDLNDALVVDITLDGADEVDVDFNMIKGGGGALTREKLVALASKRRIILVDESKLVSKLGALRSLPVEVLPFAWALSARSLIELGCTTSLRDQTGLPFVTDNGNYILDCEFGAIADPPALERQIKLLPGVVDCGLFIGIADTLVIGFDDRVEVKHRPH